MKKPVKPMPGKSVKKFKMAEPTPDKTPHPGQTEMERKILDQIGCGQYNIYDLVQSAEGQKALKDLIARDMLQPISIRDRDVQFQMTIPVHMHWCKWGADNYDPAEDDSIGGPNDK